MESTRCGGFHIAFNLVGLNAQHWHARGDLGTVFDEPFENRALFHGQTQLGHNEFSRHGFPPRYDEQFRQTSMLERLRRACARHQSTGDQWPQYAR